jgi:hypothetical protein
VPPKPDPQSLDVEFTLREVVNWTPREPSIRERILDKAKQIVTGDRHKKYGAVEDNFGTISEMWTTYFHRRGLLREGARVEDFDTAAALILLKMARIGHDPYVEDNWTDTAGYAAGGGQCALGRKEIG